MHWFAKTSMIRLNRAKVALKSLLGRITFASYHCLNRAKVALK